MKHFLKFLAIFGMFPWVSGFVLLSGPAESRLGVTPDAPTAKFVWDGKAPELNKKEEYQDGIYAEKTNEEVMEILLNQALLIWSNIPGSFIKLEMTQDANTTLNGEDNIHSIVVASSSNLTQAAFASPQLSDDEKTIRDCDISVATTKTSVKELLYTITHELGHCLGLGHNHANYGAIMGYSRDVHSATLGADDMAGILYLYRDSTKYSDDAVENMGCAVVAQGNGATHATATATAVILLIPLCSSLVTTRRRKAPR
jgi:Matrixin